ncbi:ABC transporter ATP-binding protein [Carnobacteriaceae bacterium zg-ZUI240]|nr:ABC transporter ATP-binding protein [Carnobacteriaceae bacterium zg-ZUI240]
MMSIANVITVIGPDKIKEMTNIITKGIMTSIEMTELQAVATGLLTLYLISGVLGYAQNIIVSSVMQRFSQRLRTRIVTKINRLPLNYFDQHAQGDVLSRVTNDVDTVSQSLSQSLGSLISSVILLIGTVYMMLTTSVALTGVSVASVFIGFGLMVVLIKLSQKYFTQQQSNIALINGHVEEMYTGHHIVYSYNGKEQAKTQFNVLNEALYQSSWKSQFISGLMMPMMGFIGNFGYVAVCVFGAMQVLEGHTTIGVIVAFMIYVRQFTNPLGQIAQGATNLQQASAALKRVIEFLNEEEMLDETHLQTKWVPKGSVAFEDVHFGYYEDQPIIKSFSADIKSGQKVAIVGPTGAGKTTIVNLLMKFYEVNSGAIKIDGVDISQLSRKAVHDAFGMVLQDTWLFEGTIRENLVYNLDHISEQQMIAATKAVGVHHFIKTLPHGYDTVLNDNTSLSQGQKQLMTIARALLKDAPLLILDEATSSVDTRTERLIQEAMDTLMKGRTSFVIAHRLSTIQNADVILVMKDGNIVEKGTHDSLLALNGFYADLYNSQFEEN